MEYTKRMTAAKDNFLAGYNCAQSVLLAFGDVTGLDDDTAARLASSFGGGMARMREVCGAVSGMFMAAGLIFGYGTPEVGDIKTRHYAFIRSLADEFKAMYGSIICRELLAGIETTPGGNPEARTSEYYKKRPCAQYIAACAGILERHLDEYTGQNQQILYKTEVNNNA